MCICCEFEHRARLAGARPRDTKSTETKKKRIPWGCVDDQRSHAQLLAATLGQHGTFGSLRLESCIVLSRIFVSWLVTSFHGACNAEKVSSYTSRCSVLRVFTLQLQGFPSTFHFSIVKLGGTPVSSSSASTRVSRAAVCGVRPWMLLDTRRFNHVFACCSTPSKDGFPTNPATLINVGPIPQNLKHTRNSAPQTLEDRAREPSSHDEQVGRLRRRADILEGWGPVPLKAATLAPPPR